MNIYQTNFIKNSSIALKQKRLRHINLISVQNSKINANRFNIWLTLHLNKQSRAFYISDKKANDRNPKWILSNLSKFSCKEFLVRVWYTNLDEAFGAEKQKRLFMLLEADVNLDLYVQLNDEALDDSIKSGESLLIFEIFGIKFSASRSESQLARSFAPLASSQMSSAKSSYTLSLMQRLHDFQRVIHETALKISHLKQSSVAKFDPASRLRQLQVKREQKLQRIAFLKESLEQLNASNSTLSRTSSMLEESIAQRKDKVLAFRESLDAARSTYVSLDTGIKELLKENYLFESKLKKRQKQLIAELSAIFSIEKSGEFMRILNATLRLTNPYSASTLNGYNSNNIVILSMEDIKENSIAFGYIIQCIQLLATFLCVPLRYPLVYRASKSYIIESFNDGEGNVREHALFDATQDESLNLAVSLLNKNVTQLRLLFDGYRNFDPNETLLNLKWIFDYFLN